MGDERRFSLEELADAAGMTTRNVRAYQTRGLIPPPRRVGRRSEYAVAHLERLRAIQRARERGATLTLIAEYLSHGDTIDLTRLTEQWLAVGPEAAGAVATAGSDGSGPAPASGGLPGPRVGGRPASDLSGLVRAADDPAVQAIVEELISAGVVARDGRRIVAGAGVVATVTALHRKGLPVAVALTVALRAAEGAAALADRLGPLLRPRPRVAGPIAELAAVVLRDVLVTRLDGHRRAGGIDLTGGTADSLT